MGKWIAPEFERPSSPKMRSCASTFASKGNPWMTERQSEKEYPQERQRVVTEHIMTRDEVLRQKMVLIRERTSLPQVQRIPKFDVAEIPCENPDIDMYAKAGRPERRTAVSTPERKDTRSLLAVKLAGIGRRAHKAANDRKVIV